MSEASTSWFACYTPRPDARLRLIGFPHGGGGPQAFREWGQLLSDDVELIALSLPGRGSRLHDPLITDMAELVPSVMEALPEYFDKPFAFFGHSVGAIVAYEVARALQQQRSPLPLHLFVSAHKAPHVAAHHTSMYDLPDAELVGLLRELALVPEEALENEGLLSLILPPLKADFQLSETYRCDVPMPLTVPVTALGGVVDTLVTKADLQDWEPYTTAAFDVKVFDGDHFYTQSRQAEVTQTIVQTLEADVAALPKSILQGEAAPYPDQCLHELFREQAAKTPDATAVVGDGIELTFAELDAQTDVLARYLQHQGVRVDSLVGIYMQTSVAYVIAYLSALKAGGAYMPIEVAYPDALLTRVLDTAQPVVVLTHAPFYDRLPAAWRKRAFKLDADWQHQLAAATFDVPDNLPAPTLDSLAYCVMSSGTTGTPKGMICPHRGAVNSYAWRYRYHPYEAGEREASNVFFVWEVIRPLLQGYPSYIIPDDVIYDPPRLVELLSEHRITRVLFTPSLLEQVLNTPNLDLAKKLRHLRVVYLNGEVVTSTLRHRFRELFPQVTLLNDYSISECHDVCTYDLAELNSAVSPKYAPLGLPMTNVRIYLLDDDLQPVPMGFRGEIYVGGDSVARGYLNEPDRTAERFILDPIRNDGSRLFRTGDAGRILPNGHLEIQGRIAFMVKLRGYSIVPGAVETTLAEHPAVNVAVVTTLDNEETGQPEHLVAYVVGNGQVDDDTLVEQLRPYLKDQLPHYAVPSYLIPLANLPLTAIGKLDRSRLPKPDPAALRSRSSVLVAPPETELEKAIAAVWQDLFHTDLVDTTDNFFDLGGHSLLAAELCTRLRKSLDLQVSVVDIFQYPTIRTLAQALQAQVEATPVRLDVRVPIRPFADTDIAIIGVACRFPGAEDAEQFWHNLRDGVCSIRQFSDEELAAQGVPPTVYTQPDYVKAGAVLDGVDQFDPTFWGISRREAIFMDPQHRLFLECCWQALEHAGYAPTQGGARTGVFAGAFLPSYLLHVLHGGGLMDATNPALAHLTEIGNDKDYIATRVSHLLNLRGPSVSVQTSCSTGLVTIATACQALLAGQCDTALAGAASLTFPQAGYQYVEGFVSARDGQCRAFDADASGTILGDGVGVVVLKRLEDAKAAGDHIMAVIKGFAVNNDGNLKADYSAPSVQGQAEVVAMAQAMAGVDPETITYIEAHGTGTLIGDPIEVRALTTAFQQTATHTGFCGLGSVKPNIGHSNIAAGVAGLIKIILCLQHRQLAPTINFSTLNPAMELEGTPFYINDRLRAWESPNGAPRRAGVTSLGIGGTNCHMIVEEWVEPASAAKAVPMGALMPHLLTVSAKTPAALEQNTRNLIEHLQAHPNLNLADVAYTLQVGREAFPHRWAVACGDGPAAIAQLTQVAKPQSSAPAAPGTRSVVFMFSGQGAQYLGMGKGLYETIPAFRQYVETCSEYLKPLIEADLCEMLYRVEGHPEVLNRADFLQPALFSVEYAMARTLIAWGVQPQAVVGHSLGEYAAACIAGIVSLEDALALVVTRGKAMETAGAGAMLAVNQSEDDMRAWLASREPHVFADGPDVGLAAINAPGRVVLSGSCQAIAQVERELQGADIAYQRVHVARAFHSPMMQAAAEAMTRKAEIVTLHPPTISLASNLSGTWLTDAQAQDPAYWRDHMLQPVRFADNIQTLLQQQPDILLEVGPGRILSGLAGEILRHRSDLAAPLIAPSMRHPREQATPDAQFLMQTLARLWVTGVDLDWQALHAGATRQRVPLPSYAFDRQRCWPENGMAQPSLPPLVPSPNGKLPDGKLALSDRFYLPSWQRTLSPAREPLHDSARWLVFLGSTGTAGALGADLAAALEQQGHEVMRVYRDDDAVASGKTEARTVVINPNRADDYVALLQQLDQADLTPQRLVYLWTLDHANAAVESVLSHAYDHLLHLAQALTAHATQDPCALWIITDQTVQVNQEDVQPVKATLLGPSTVLPQENPQVSCWVVDVQLPDEPGDVAGLVEHLLHECTPAVPDVEPVIAWRGEHRWTPRYEPLTFEASANGVGKRWLQSHKTYIITGGLGRIGLELCQYLAQLPSHLVLTTRKVFPDRAQWEALAVSLDVEPILQSTLKQLLQCEAAGATVRVVQADMADADDVQRLCAETIDCFGAISGIFHAAGAADLRYLQDLSPEICEQEFAPKLYGVLHLERAIGQLPHKPEFVVLFSSMAAILGGLAMTAYVAANRFMDAFVQTHPRRHGVSWLSINWDDWDFTYTKEQIAAYEKTQAAGYAMTPAEGFEALERILAYRRPMQLLVVTRPLKARIAQWLHQQAIVSGTSDFDVNVAAPTDTDDVNALEQHIAGVYQEVLGLPSVEVEDNFFDLGGDSLLASQILLQLRRQLPQAVSVQLHAIFDHPTVRDMAKHVAEVKVEV